MKTTIEFLEGVKSAHSLVSDYALADFLGVTRQTVSKYRVGKDFLGDETAIKVAKALKIAPAYVLSCVHFERAKKAEEKAVWQSIIEKFGGLAASVLLGVALFGSAPDFASAQGDFFNRPVYTLCEAARRNFLFSLAFIVLPFFPRLQHIFTRR